MAAALVLAGAVPAGPESGAEIRVGISEGDIRGDDQRALQAAVDYVARLGGGTVHIGPGRYQMRNALRLCNKVHVRGVPGKTVLVPCAACRARLAADGDCNEEQVTLEDAGAFRVGDGVVIRDGRFPSGFTLTTATLTARLDERTFRISTPLYLDYMVSNKAEAVLAFPVVGGWDIKDASVEGLIIEAERKEGVRFDGCRLGGIYLFRCSDVSVRNCCVRGYHGDGISFQVSHRIKVEDCLCEGNAGYGLHPGSGSQHPILRRNRSINNGDDGMYVCWRVRHGQFEDNEIRGNRGTGICIGHKDSDNLFRGNTITANGRAGILFREESVAMGAHRNVFEGNRILDNGTAATERDAAACIIIRGHHHDLVFRKNTIGRSRAASGGVGILQDKHVQGLQAVDNQFPNLERATRAEGR